MIYETQSTHQSAPNPTSSKTRTHRIAGFHGSTAIYLIYALIALSTGITSAIFLWWSVRPKLPYEPAAGLLFIQVMKYAPEALTSRATYLNGIVLALIYLLCVTLVNRFWAGTAVFTTFVTVYGIATKIKITMRDEPIIPSDLDFLTGKGGGAKAITSFVTSDSRKLIISSIIYLIFFILLCVGLQIIDKTPFIRCSWRNPLKRRRNNWALIARILAPFICVALLTSYASGICQPHSLIYRTLHSIGYKPMLWSTRTDAQHNGSLNTFLSLTHVDAMQTEPDYSPAAMQIIYDRYAKVANSINAKRTQNLTDSTVVMVLSESFSDPNRVPGVHFDKDPMPNIRKLGSTTTSGLMLSPGYGGGTANIEFQQLTGLTMANYNASLLTPYQQLLPQRSQFYSFNTIWNASCGKIYSTNCSVGYHPYSKSFYMRQANYKKMGFSHFYALDSDPAIPHGKQYVGTNGEQGYVPDSEAYQNVIDSIQSNTKEHKPSQYIQLITMQNHAPYTDLYGSTNEFRQTNASAHMPDEERDSIANYAKGVQRTDIATSDFLSALDSINHPVTVVFYGDHLPGIYATAGQNDENLLALHETNYFIWSNKASFSNDRKLSQSNAAFSSSNYFMAQAAELMDAKVSPYLALLQELHHEIPAMSRSTTHVGAAIEENSTIYLNDKGKEMDSHSLSSHAQRLLADYKMVQYDMSVGENYLMDTGFTSVPAI